MNKTRFSQPSKGKCKTCGKPEDKHKPSDYLREVIKKTNDENNASPIFDNAEDAIKWLND